MLVIVVVVLAAALHASWNAIVKSIDDPLTVMAVLGLATTAVCLPVALIATPPPGDAVPFLVGSVVVHGVYNLLLVALYGDTDFNQAYPLARGISPPAGRAVRGAGRRRVAPAAGRSPVLVVLSAGLLGVALPGSGGRGRVRSRNMARSRRTVGLAVLTGLSIATYTVLDGVGVPSLRDAVRLWRLVVRPRGDDRSRRLDLVPAPWRAGRVHRSPVDAACSR